MAEATLSKDGNANTYDVTAPEALSAGEVFQLCNGRAAVTAGLAGFASGDPATGIDKGQFTVAKIAAKVVLDGGKLFWDRSASTASPIETADSFYLGCAVGDALAAATTVVVDLNVLPNYLWELGRPGDRHTTVATTTAGAPACTHNQMNYFQLLLESNDEAECVDILSDKSVPLADGPIFETKITFDEKGDNAAVDTVFGLVNASHTSDADAITESVLFSNNGGDTKINCESDDGTTEVGATDSTIVLVEDTAQEFWIDARDPADCHLYIDGVEALASTTFVLTDATGPFKALVLVEKSGGAHVPSILIDWLRLRATDLA